MVQIKACGLSRIDTRVNGFMGRGFTSRGQESGSVFSVAVCKIQASKCYIKSLLLVLKEAASLKVKDLLYSCLLLIAFLPSGSWTLN